jgi:hypothetical protein
LPCRTRLDFEPVVVATVALTARAFAQAPTRPASLRSKGLDTVRITAHYDNSIGTSDAASAGRIDLHLIADRPILRPAEVMELVPGLIVTQHSGGGKANQYFLPASISTTALTSRRR